MLTILKYTRPNELRVQQSIPITVPAGGYSIPGAAPIGVILESRRLGDNADDISYILGNTWENIMQGGRTVTHTIIDTPLQELGIMDKPKATGVRVSSPQGQAVLDYQVGNRYSPGTEAGTQYRVISNYLDDPTSIGVMNGTMLENLGVWNTPKSKSKSEVPPLLSRDPNDRKPKEESKKDESKKNEQNPKEPKEPMLRKIRQKFWGNKVGDMTTSDAWEQYWGRRVGTLGTSLGLGYYKTRDWFLSNGKDFILGPDSTPTQSAQSVNTSKPVEVKDSTDNYNTITLDDLINTVE